MNVNEIPVVIFELEERTRGLSKLCFEKLGFENIIILDQEEPFSKKMERFFELSLSEKYRNFDLFIRTDADRLVFDGIKDMATKSIEALNKSKDGFVLSEGNGYERFMERLRGATPHIYSKNLISYILENKNKLIKNIQKPESHIGAHCKNDLNCFYFFDILTNLHEFEQYPSKMFNAFLNRIHRGHLGYYDLNKILNDSFYGESMKMAIDEFNMGSSKDLSLAYTKKDLQVLIDKDKILGPINEKKYDMIYDDYRKLYKLLNERYLNNV